MRECSRGFEEIYFFLLINIAIAMLFLFFFFNDTATTEIYTLSLHDALPIFLHLGLLDTKDIRPLAGKPILNERDPASNRICVIRRYLEVHGLTA